MMSPISLVLSRSRCSLSSPLVHRTLSSTTSTIVDMRSDTVTKPCPAMYAAMLAAPTGDDVFREDPTVARLETHLSTLFKKESALFFPTGTMSNLCAILGHADRRGSEVILGAKSHLCQYEGGNVSQHGGVHSRQLHESPTDSTLPIADVLSSIRDDDVHYPRTALVCIENTHNITGGVPLQKAYIDDLKAAIKPYNIPLHIDGARIFNATVALGLPPAELCASADSVSICLSKGLGTPIGSVLVGSNELISKAIRTRKSLGGGMRQAGVIAAAGLYALEHNVERLKGDHERMRFLCDVLSDAEFHIPRRSETNLLFFGLPPNSKIGMDEYAKRLKSEHGVLIGSGYAGGSMARAVCHKFVTDEGIEKAARVMVELAIEK